MSAFLFFVCRCQFLHRTAGDTERRYHLRYFKTCMCVYETDNRGFCTKNGAHCAFAHGELDKRPPVFDIRELQVIILRRYFLGSIVAAAINLRVKQENLPKFV